MNKTIIGERGKNYIKWKTKTEKYKKYNLATWLSNIKPFWPSGSGHLSAFFVFLFDKCMQIVSVSSSPRLGNLCPVKCRLDTRGDRIQDGRGFLAMCTLLCHQLPRGWILNPSTRNSAQCWTPFSLHSSKIHRFLYIHTFICYIH